MKIWVYTLLSVFITSLLSLIGVFTLSLKKETFQKILIFFVSFAIGGLFGDAFIHLIPESFRQMGINFKPALYVLLGILVFFVLEKLIRLKNCHDEHCTGHLKPFVTIILVGDTFHNFIDGMVIGASYAINTQIGITTTLAVFLHEIPHEIGDFSALVHGGLPVKRALLFNFLTALASILGAVISLAIGQNNEGYKMMLLPFTAGGFIYLAGSDLIPELQQDSDVVKSIFQLLFIILGIGIMLLMILFE